jgi:hypothetical protein
MMKASLLTIGTLAAALGCWGAFEYALKLEGCISYLALAAPVVAAASALIPFYAERAWQAKHRFKALVWIAVLIPTAATMFFAAAERVHVAKAGAEAERAAIRSAVERAVTVLDEAKASAKIATAAADTVRGLKRCSTRCQTTLASETAALKRVDDAEAALKHVQAKAAVESPLKAPVWLLPLSLDLLSFVALWTGLGWNSPKPTSKRKITRRRRKSTPKRPPPTPAATYPHLVSGIGK